MQATPWMTSPRFASAICVRIGYWLSEAAKLLEPSYRVSIVSNRHWFNPQTSQMLGRKECSIMLYPHFYTKSIFLWVLLASTKISKNRDFRWRSSYWDQRSRTNRWFHYWRDGFPWTSVCHASLVGGLEHFFIFPYIGNNNPNWLS